MVKEWYYARVNKEKISLRERKGHVIRINFGVGVSY